MTVHLWLFSRDFSHLDKVKKSFVSFRVCFDLEIPFLVPRLDQVHRVPVGSLLDVLIVDRDSDKQDVLCVFFNLCRVLHEKRTRKGHDPLVALGERRTDCQHQRPSGQIAGA